MHTILTCVAPGQPASRSFRSILNWPPVSHDFFPQFNDRFEAIAVRVPTINVTAIDLSVTVKKPVKANEVNLLLQKAAQGAFHGIVDYTELPLVSVDFNHDPHSAIVDGTQTQGQWRTPDQNVGLVR